MLTKAAALAVILAAQAGDPAAFERVVSACMSQSRGCTTTTLDHDDLKQVARITIADALKRFEPGKVPPGCGPFSYFRSAVRRASLAARESQRWAGTEALTFDGSLPDQEDGAPSPFDLAAQAERVRLVRQCVGKVPNRPQPWGRWLQARYLDGLDADAAEVACGMRPGQGYGLDHEALRRLRRIVTVRLGED